MLDVTALAEFAAHIVDQLEADDEVPADATLTDAHIIVEVRGTSPDGDPTSMVQGFTMSERNVVGVGLTVRSLAAHLRHDDE